MTDRIVLKGRSEDMLSILRSSDAFLMTSDYEGMPNALLEAMVVGLPCISTDCRTGPKDMIDDGVNGYLVKTGDAESISRAIVKMAQMSDTEAKKMGSAAREKILDICGTEKSLKRLVEVIEE
jgi:glycosyltransferase involved in cell wall biosynthesis